MIRMKARLTTFVFLLLLGGPLFIPNRTFASPAEQFRLILRLSDNGGRFTVPIGAAIWLQIPHVANSQLSYDPSILRLISPLPVPVEQELNAPDVQTPQSPSADSIVTSGVWQLQTIAPGTTWLSLYPVRCQIQPCPMYPDSEMLSPTFNFNVTIVVEGGIVPPPPPTMIPPIPPSPYSVYVGTASLGQTIRVQPGQILLLELPSLIPEHPVRLLFNSNILSLLPGQPLTYAPVGGWQFRVISSGTTDLLVMEKGCQDSRTGAEGKKGCTPKILFRVIVNSQP